MHNQIQSKRILQHEHRLVLSQMLSGYLRHCELSAHLKGFARDTFYFDGVKYCIPVFTFMGPSLPGLDTRVVGIVSATDSISDISLELMERLIVNPKPASGYYLRILPVENPVQVEKGTPGPEEVQQVTQEIIARQKAYCTDGLIELRTNPSSELTIQLSGNHAVWKAAKASLTLFALEGEQQEVQLEPLSDERIDTPSDHFDILISIPKEKDNLFTAFLVNRFILHFLQIYATLEQRQALSA